MEDDLKYFNAAVIAKETSEAASTFLRCDLRNLQREIFWKSQGGDRSIKVFPPSIKSDHSEFVAELKKRGFGVDYFESGRGPSYYLISW